MIRVRLLPFREAPDRRDQDEYFVVLRGEAYEMTELDVWRRWRRGRSFGVWNLDSSLKAAGHQVAGSEEAGWQAIMA
jgi:hypothetical protein